MLRVLLFLIFSLIALDVQGAYYVRTNGSNDTNCTGTTDADYDGSGTGEACAFNHPFYATGWWGDGSISSNGQASAMASGDDLIISCNDSHDCTGVTFNMGYSSSWSGMSASWTYGGFMRPVTSGTSGNHTTIKGCSSTGCSDASKRPGFTGFGRNQMTINLKGSSYVDIQDIDVYDTATCGSGHALYGCGSADDAEASARDNIDVTSADNISLKNMKVWGAYRYGIYGGSVTTVTLDNVDISYNSFGGWDGDSCGGAGTCGLAGTITFQNGSKVTYNGCVATSSYGTIASEGCYSQDQSGYGDGIGFGDTGGSWVFADCDISHNTSDGIDLLYLNKGSYSGGSASIKRCKFEGNAGNNVKVPNNMTFEDSYNIANCGYFYGQAFTCTSGSCSNSFNNCRANGNAFSIDFKSGDNSTPRISSSTIVTNSDVAIMTGGTCTTGIDVFVSNNVMIGGREFLDDTGINAGGGNDSTSIYYDAGTDGNGANCDTDFVDTYNLCYLFKEGASSCNGTGSTDGTSVPASFFTGTLAQGPLSGDGYYTDADYYTQLDLHASSLAKDYSDETFSGADSLDFNSYNRGANWDNGAIEYGSTQGGGGGGSTTKILSLGSSMRLTVGSSARIQF